MESFELPQFSPGALAVLDRMPFDPTARSRYDLMSDGLIWSDEFPPPGSAAWALVRTQWVYRYLIAYRRAVTLGEERAGFLPVWEQVARHAPNWPGLRPERRGERAARRLRAALRGQDACLAALEAQLGEGSDGAGPAPNT
ncbi:hypothetical protein GobsT_60360 [Gemmata obscuriglobus]|uniref:Uncharacterized protein n=1 Tax=Gemmata obscuriglobus TaxID=114 RepID=A0A2Z3GUH2_9BACT|nr:hypothetical protein [Gemmata obscuriglobus]AWM36191.1 hypothetical protein C1280_03640 [Gemmata obscuriglobus]QEG31215.1 hypothetical protein GobsT_60360 [Gemmata obscuriglobus]VTS10553.1 Uncharacterized protein OS=Rhodopirellula baltica WH47 GN=RBWH47_05568 PE=4 SV=1 [Gemmata obscuriglobus UQM 2246]